MNTLPTLFLSHGSPMQAVEHGIASRTWSALGRALAPLAREGVLIVGSGHATHNLRDWMNQRGRGDPMPYAKAFARWLDERLAAHDTEALVDYRERAPDAARAHPSEEHILPLHVAWGAAGSDARVEHILTGFEGPALALDSWLFHPPH